MSPLLKPQLILEQQFRFPKRPLKFKLKRALQIFLFSIVLLSSTLVEATLIGGEFQVTRHFQLLDGTDQYAPATALSAIASEGLGPEISDFGSWRLNMHVDVEASSIILSERGHAWGGDGYITSFATNNNFHRLEISGLNFSDPDLQIVDATLGSMTGNMPVTDDDILFGADFVHIEIGGWWDDLSQVVINLESGRATVPEPPVIGIILIGFLALTRLRRKIAC